MSQQRRRRHRRSKKAATKHISQERETGRTDRHQVRGWFRKHINENQVISVLAVLALTCLLVILAHLPPLAAAFPMPNQLQTTQSNYQEESLIQQLAQIHLDEARQALIQSNNAETAEPTQHGLFLRPGTPGETYESDEIHNKLKKITALPRILLNGGQMVEVE